MKIALVAERVDPWRGGAETSAMQFIHHLTEQGIEVELYTRSHPPSAAGLGVRTIEVHGLSRGYRTLSFLRRVDKMLSSETASAQYDLVHALTPCLTADVYQPRGGTIAETIARNVALRKSGAARTVKRLVNRLNLKQQISYKFERELLNRKPPPTIIALSDYVVEQLRRHYTVAPEKIRKVFNGTDHELCGAEQRAQDRRTIRNLYNIGDDEILALFVAHNFKLKGLARWIEALRLIKERNHSAIKSVVVGKDNALPYRKLAGSLDVLDLVTFAGPSQRVQAFLHAADIFVHPTYYDPCSRVVLEAMLSGVPCVTTRYNGAAEIIEDGVNGRIIESPDDVESLAGAVEESTSARFRRALIESHDDLAERLSMKRHAREVVELYRELTLTAAVS